eukprot:350468-Chlamydomonas_euryale.AAC.2
MGGGNGSRDDSWAHWVGQGLDGLRAKSLLRTPRATIPMKSSTQVGRRAARSGTWRLLVRWMHV